MLPVLADANTHMDLKLNAKQLRLSSNKTAQKTRQQLIHQPLVLVLDNVMDTYNIGSFFRLADAISASKLYLCGQTYTPPNIKIHRSSIGTWKWVDWQHCQSAIDCLHQLKADGYQIVSCEINKKSILYNKANYKLPVALVAGSESTGISSSILKMSDLIVEIPMYGVNKSLNTLTATSIISYHILSSSKSSQS